jgi:hypothetical protein
MKPFKTCRLISGVHVTVFARTVTDSYSLAQQRVLKVKLSVFLLKVQAVGYVVRNTF